MGYFDTEHDVAITPTAGVEVGFLDSIAQGYSEQFKVNSPYSLEAEIYNRWVPTLKEYRARTGDTTEVDISYSSIQEYFRASEGLGQNWFHSNLDGSPNAQVSQRVRDFQKVNNQIRAMNDPELRPLEDVIEEVKRMQAQVRETSADYDDRSGFIGGLGQFIGAVAGSFSERDPFSLYTLGIGGFGKGVLSRVLTEGAVQAGIAGASDVLAVNPNLEAVGLDPNDPVMSIVTSAVGGMAIRGGVEGLASYLARRMTAKPEAISTDLPNDLVEKLASAEPPAGLRAAIDLYESYKLLDEVNPYGDSPEAGARFVADVSHVAQVLGGKTDTAIGRMMPVELPFEIRARDADTLLVEAEAPQLLQAVEDAAAKLALVTADADEIAARIDAVSIAETLDPETAALVRSFEEDLSRPDLPKAQKERAAKQIGMVVESLGIDVEKTIADLQIKPRKQLREKRQAVREANREYRKAQEAVTKKIAEIKKRQEVVKNLTAPPARVTSEYLNYTKAAEVSAQAAEVAAGVPDSAAAVVRAMNEVDGKIDIGLQEPVDAEFAIPILNDDGSEIVMTVRELMQELQEDLSLEEAVKVCAR